MLEGRVRRLVPAAAAAVLAVAVPLASGATNNIFTAAGTGTAGYDGDDKPAAEAQLAVPVWVATTADGGYLISDQGTSRIRRVSAGGRISTIAGNGTAGFSGDGGPATSAQINAVNGLAQMPDGGFLLADSNIEHDGSTLRASWSPVDGASRYAVVATLASGGQRRITTRRTSAVLRGVRRSTGGRVAVFASDTGRPGAASTARFRATAGPPATRVRRQPRPPRALRG